MPHRDACELTFFEWLDTLTDEEHTAVLEDARALAAELGVRVERKSTITHNLLELDTHRPSILSLN